MGTQENYRGIGEFVDAVRHALVPATTRSELVSGLCESFPTREGDTRLWLGELDGTGTVIRPHAAAGVDRDALEAVPLDGSSAAAEALEAALTTGESQFVDRPVDGESDSDGQRTPTAVVPLIPAGTPYGALWITQETPFDADDRTALATLREALESALEAFDADGAVDDCGDARDITDPRSDERRLSRHRDRLTALTDRLLETVPTGVMMFDADGELAQFNQRAADIMGSSGVAAMNGAADSEWVLTTADGEPLSESAYPATRVLETGEALYSEEFRLEHPTNDPVWLSVNGAPVPEPQGATAAVLAFEDITDQKERERYLQDAKSQLEAATDAGAVGTWEWHIPEDRFVCGASFARTFGVDPDEARSGVPLEELTSSIHAADRERVAEQIREAVDGCEEYEAEYRVWDADGELRWVVARGHVECDEDGNPETFPGALADITDRKQVEEALKRHKDQLRTLIRLLPVGVVVAGAEGRFIEANETAKQIWGGDVFDAESPADYEKFPVWSAETGEPVTFEDRPMNRVLAGEELTEPEVLEMEAADGTRRVIMVHGMPVRDPTGDVSRGVVTITDITERKRREQQLERQNNRLESFASMLAHELRNPLSIGKIYLPAATDGDRAAASEVETALDRIEKTIEMLLVLTRGTELAVDPQPVSLGETAADVWSGLDEPVGSLRIESDPVIDVEPTHLTHLLENLFRNSVEHGSSDDRDGSRPDDAGSVTVRVGALEDGFYVEDTGPGIPADRRERVFEAGYTTGATGLGLGLTFIAQLAETYGWECAITDADDGGARFEFTGVTLVPRPR
ncbi:PAS domain S-box protein [Natrononativus amylolyticus]|uniref:PAS domain S-box protein n=1 Tax=Natrononativus amylolyticus TaxID=2963434 RepID=UPI0020CF6596|nr:PAS domain S-box protein [Natrononativus amylolyticus]